MPFDLCSPDTQLLPPTSCTEVAAKMLRELACYLRSLPNGQWYYADHLLGEGGHDGQIRKTENLALCGTVGCALGHCWARNIDTEPMKEGLPREVYNSFFYNGGDRNQDGHEGIPYPKNWRATQFDVADRIDHWLRTGAIR